MKKIIPGVFLTRLNIISRLFFCLPCIVIVAAPQVSGIKLFLVNSSSTISKSFCLTLLKKILKGIFLSYSIYNSTEVESFLKIPVQVLKQCHYYKNSHSACYSTFIKPYSDSQTAAGGGPYTCSCGNTFDLISAGKYYCSGTQKTTPLTT